MIHCNDLRRNIRKNECYFSFNNHVCKICPNAVIKKNDKDKYRNKSYTPPKNKIQPDKSTKAILARINKINKNDHERKELYDILQDIGRKGGELDVIIACLHPEDILSLFQENSKDTKGLQSIMNAIKKKGIWQVDLLHYKDSQKQDVLQEHSKKVAKWGREKGQINKAVNQLLKAEPLPEGYHQQPALHKNLNKELDDVKRTVKSIFDRYIQLKEWMQFPPPTVMRSEDGQIIRNSQAVYHVFLDKPIGKKKHRKLLQINEKIRILTDELTRIGYAKKSACRITDDILKLSYPIYHDYKDSDPDRVKSSLRYHGKE